MTAMEGGSVLQFLASNNQFMETTMDKSNFMRVVKTDGKDAYIDPHSVKLVMFAGEKVCDVLVGSIILNGVHTSAASFVKMIDEWVEDHRPSFEVMERLIPDLDDSYSEGLAGPSSGSGPVGIKEVAEDEIDITPPEVAVEYDEPKVIEELPPMTFQPTAEGLPNNDLAD